MSMAAHSVASEEKVTRRSLLGYIIAGIGALVATVIDPSTSIFAASPVFT